MRRGENSRSRGGRLMRAVVRIGLSASLCAALLLAPVLGWASFHVGGQGGHFSDTRGGWGMGPRRAAFRVNGRGGGFAGFQTRSQREGGRAAGGARARPEMWQGQGMRQGNNPRNNGGYRGAYPGYSGMRAAGRPGQEHLPAWWQAHRGLSQQQQADALRREPGFRNLPPGQQQRLLNRLHSFDQRPPLVQQRMMDRNEMFERLSPERQQEVRGAAQALARMSPGRQAVMRHAFQQLRQMPPQERQRMLNSTYSAQFTPQERTVLGNMLSIEPYQEHIIQPYFGR